MVWSQATGWRHEGGAVALIEGGVVTRFHLIAEDGWVPFQIAGMGAGIGVQQQLVVVEAMPILGLVGAMDAIAIDLARPDAADPAMEDLVGVFGQLDALQLRAAIGVEQADLDLGGIGREQREVHALPVPGGAARMRQAFANETTGCAGQAGTP
jgi:hypothetical protein